MLNSGFVIVKELSSGDLRDKYFFDDKIFGNSNIAEIISTTKNSIFKKGDIIVYERDSYYFSVDEINNDSFYLNESTIHSKIVNGSLVGIRDVVYLKIDKDTNHSLNVGGNSYYKDVDYNEFSYENRTQHGEVVAVPLTATDSFTKYLDEIPVEINCGETVYSNHIVTDEANKRNINGICCYEIRYEDCYLSMDDAGNIKMLNKWNLIQPIDEDISNMKMGKYFLKEEISKETHIGIVEELSNSLKGQNVYAGDEVMFKYNRDYPININGKLFYVVNTKDIIAKKNNSYD